jgi:methylmalonyl-CoA/ethylmalonyl-CoA epimerase
MTGSFAMEQFEFHHFGVAVRELRQAIAFFGNLFGYELRSGPFEDPIQHVSVCFLGRGHADPAVELVAPLGPQSPVDGKLRKGCGVYHVCYQVPDIHGAIDRLTQDGSLLLSGPVPAVAFEMREIAWLMTKAGLLIELVAA